ncbi:response regulator transcription factor [Phenylobacterium sp.]|uniref:response regulator transcription factor n=1 Tax=Phenylobacterium sp. TaxID=1871053 RepID=UPI00272FF85D|nr:response regulator transcription factor [Phenylobacterium sp.]MDP1874498.1 response regulator transcription factor [Phenylobacterium sp.]
MDETRGRSAMILEEKPLCRGAIAAVVAGLAGFGEPTFTSSLSEADAQIGLSAPDLFIVDLFSVEYDFEGLARLIHHHKSVRVMVIDDRINPAFVRLAKDAGAVGYACKNYEIDLLEAAIAAVAGGRLQFPATPPLTTPTGRSARSIDRLSPRQLEVLKCIAVGMGNQEIADTLGITLGTAKAHIHTILKLTGTRNRTEVALIAGRFLA